MVLEMIVNGLDKIDNAIVTAPEKLLEKIGKLSPSNPIRKSFESYINGVDHGFHDGFYGIPSLSITMINSFFNPQNIKADQRKVREELKSWSSSWGIKEERYNPITYCLGYLNMIPMVIITAAMTLFIKPTKDLIRKYNRL